MKVSHALLAAAVAQQASATWNLFAKPFTSPDYNNNECSDKQKGGFDWSDLKDGDSDFQYGDFDFSAGWKCSSAFGKRDSLTKRTFGNKAIVNKCSKKQPATFGCNKRQNGFSITTIDVSVEFDVEIDLHYTMNDGSLCKQKSVPCKKEGSTVTNTQCGGAKSVQVYLGSNYKGSKSDCQIGFHHIGFDCNPGKPYNPPKPPTPPSPPTPPKQSYHASPPPPPAMSSPPPAASSSPPPAVSSPPASCGGEGGYGAGCPPVQTPPAQSAPYSSMPPYANVSTHVPPPPPPPTYETTVVSHPSEASSSAVSTPAMSSEVVSSPPSYQPSPPPQPSPPAKGGDVPPQLPQCMNTWLQISTEDCKDNTAVDCYCKNSKFTKNVIDCVQAWCETDEQTKQALQYLVGICASYVPQNPGIVSDCPKDSFTPPSPPSPPAGGAKPSSPAPSMPVTTITYGSTSITVPQVYFTTPSPVAGDATPTAPVGLVPGNAPPSVPAGTTAPPYPVASTLKPSTYPTGTGAVRPSSPAQFTGAASPIKLEPMHAMLGAALAFLAL